MKVNMTPNPLDVVTIHASQGDTEARQWEFELHNNGELIDTSEITEQLFFKAYKGGTEQILPENTSTPTTSPFKGDIRYPQGLLTDQEFTYRQSPTEEDGLAKITDIKGNTLVWNQISVVPFTEVKSGVTFTRSDDRTALQMSGTSTSTIYKPFSDMAMTTVGHVYYVDKGADSTLFQLYNDNGGISTETNNRRAIGRATAQKSWYFRIPNGTTIDVTAKPMIIDLTQMGLDSITDPSDFTSLFNLPYYAYNQGSLLSFSGNGIKTVGFNQWDEEWEVGAITAQGTPSITADRIRSKNFIPVIPSKTYYRKTPNNLQPFFYDANQQFIEYGFWGKGNFTTPSNCAYMKFQVDPVYGLTYNNDICINISSSRNGEYEPYKESSLSLPISQYFPNGMKSAKNAYDELSDTKATVRIKSLTVNGSEAWVKSTSYPGNYYVLGLLSDVKLPSANAVSNSLLHVYGTGELATNDLCFMFDGSANSQNVNIKNTSMTTVDQFKAWLQANPVTIYYELKTPTETPFTTASLVTENAEIPLSNEDGTLIGKCTEQLSENPGFIDAKIKLSDSDGECYSNKIQLHVERSPQ